MRRSSYSGAGYLGGMMMDTTDIPIIEPQYRSVSYVETKAKGSALQWFAIGLALYVSYSVGVTAGKQEILVSDYGTVMVDGKVFAMCTGREDGGAKCERHVYQ
jgi:hypothetical protein